MDGQTIKLAPGLRVVIRDEEWVIKKVETNSFGGKTLFCIGVSPMVQDQEEIFLADLENNIDIIDPANTRLVADDSPLFRKSRLYIESQLRQRTPTDNALHIGYKAAMDALDFQLEPAQIALSQPRQRILIADSVGLGKTLEAGILMSELIARGKGKRILVVTVKSMMTQFQKEMWNRFDIALTRLDSKAIAKIRSKLPSNYNPFYFFDKTIISVDTLKRDIEYRTHLEKAYWDIIVIDEAHNVANRGDTSQRSRLAELLAERSDTLIMLSATPHDGKAKSFASLMNMLDKTAIADPNNYTKDDVGNLCIRRFKKDVRGQLSGSFQERQVYTEKCHASQAEEDAYEFLANLHLVMDANASKKSDQLFRTIIEKSLFSSPAACLATLAERHKKLVAKYNVDGIEDIKRIEELIGLLQKIEPKDFSRYQKLLSILSSPEYGWKKQTDDRIVIFTERIETMKYLAARLREDLGLKEEAVQELYGGMSDQDQQKIVEDFGRTESPIRVLVASDVASEGINLHYLSHRLIHFDIPWSLMVFQQRNGRIDRYGQAKKPDIRYLVSESDTMLSGDIGILEILIKKEKRAYDNIGDPTLLMGKFDIKEEEQITFAAIQEGLKAEQFDESIGDEPSDFGEDMFAELMNLSQSSAPAAVKKENKTFFSDLDYLKRALAYFSITEKYQTKEMETVQGIEIKLLPGLKARLQSLLPEEAMPNDDTLRLSPDKAFCMQEMKKSMQNSMDEAAWPRTQYLWSLHPIFNWINDKCRLFFGRAEAPLIVLNNDSLNEQEMIYLVAGSVPNRKSTSVIDEWFGLFYKNGRFVQKMSLEDVLAKTRFGSEDIPNTKSYTEDDITEATACIPDAVDNARKVMDSYCKAYTSRTEPILEEYLVKLEKLEIAKKAYQLSLFESEKRRTAEERKVDQIFESYEEWYRDTIQIENASYIRILAVLKGGAER